MILVDGKKGCFHLQAGRSSYVLGVLDGRYLVHGYWGPALSGKAVLSQMVTPGGRPYSVVENLSTGSAESMHRHWRTGGDHRKSPTTITAPGTDILGSGLSDRRRRPEEDQISVERLPLEYPTAGSGDLRCPAMTVRLKDGIRCIRPDYSGYEILDGYPGPAGLPWVTALEGECSTLRIDLTDAAAGIEVNLFYLPLPEVDVILRWSRIRNESDSAVTVEAAASASVDLPAGPADVITLDGSWSRERHFHRRPAAPGLQQVQSRGGASGHHHSPFMAVADRDATETCGQVRGVSLMYSGNHREVLERDRYGGMRLQAGINPEGFAVHLPPGENIDSPGAVLAFSNTGLGGLSANHHRFVRSCLLPEPWRNRNRPVIANTWEAHYFDVNRDNVVALAGEAKEIGAEVLVLDDGWFKNRIDDHRALGDWIPDEGKFPGGLGETVNAIRELGMGFGIWVEPEMVNPESELFRRHPEWILRAEGREPMMARNQLILDLSRPEVVDYLMDLLSGIFSSAPITYVKWDMNRYMAEIGNPDLPAERQGEVTHRYMLGLYRLWGTLIGRFPHILFEGCAGGGGRFDFGSLAYMPQFWTSDQTDAVERQKIQYGTSLLFPPECMGAHVSAVPNHQLGRITSAETRGLTALAFNFGFELDLANETDGDKAVYRELSKLYKENRELFRTGTFHRLLPAPAGTPVDALEGAPANRHAWMIVAEDGRRAMVFCFRTLAEADDDGFRLKLQGLDPEAVYRDTASGAEFDAVLLENLGLWVPPSVGDFRSLYWSLERNGR